MPFSLSSAIGRPIPTIQIVDIGASMVEGADHYAPLVAEGCAEVVGFEPDPIQFQRLQDSGRAHYRYLPYALGTGGPATFHVARFPGCSSIFPPNRTLIDRFTPIGATGAAGNFTVVDTVEIETHRLDDVLDGPAPDYLKLDIQGAERDVLTHGTQALASALVVDSEVLFVPLYEGQGDFADLTLLMRERGFQLLECRDIHRCTVAPFLAERKAFSSRGQWMWADAVYVRRWDTLEAWTLDQLLKGAAILHSVYHAHDLVHHLLLEVQIRTEQPLANRYRAALSRDPSLNGTWEVIRRAWAKALNQERLQQRPQKVDQRDPTPNPPRADAAVAEARLAPGPTG